MSNYFRVFPSIDYNFKAVNTTLRTQDFTKRFKFLETILKHQVVYYPYTVKDGERPDIIAHKYYGDSSLDWLILMSNQRYDPHFDWHMDNQVFSEYIRAKYGSISAATQSIHSYYIVINEKEEVGYREFTEQKLVEVDQATFNTTAVDSRLSKTFWDWEQEQNEKRRVIRLIDATFIPAILREYEKIFNDSTTT